MDVKRATFEQVYKAQSDFIFGETGIDILAEKKETVAPESRKIFFENFAISLIGKGLNYDYVLEYDGGVYNLGSLSVFARKMAYFVDTDDRKQKIQLKDRKVPVPIDILWNTLRECMYKPMDEALTLALKSSAEIFRGGGDSYSVNPEDNLE